MRYVAAPALIILLLVLTSAPVTADPQGWGLGLGVFDGDFGVHARKDFMLGEVDQYEIVLQGGLYNQNKWTGRVDADFHYVITPESSFRLYPLIGLDWAIQNKSNRLGVNLGGGFTFNLNAYTRLFVEAKYVAGDWSGYGLAGGIYF